MAVSFYKAGAGLALALLIALGGVAGCAQFAKDLDAISSASPKIIPDKKAEDKNKPEPEARPKAGDKPKAGEQAKAGDKVKASPKKGAEKARPKADPAKPHVFKSDSPYLRLTLPPSFKVDRPWPHETGILARAWLRQSLRLDIKVLPRDQGETMAMAMARQREKLQSGLKAVVGAPENAFLGGLSGVRFGFELEGVSYLRYLLPDQDRLYQVTLATKGKMTKDKALAYVAGLRLNPDPTGAAKQAAELSVRDMAYSFGARQMDLAVKLSAESAREKTKAAAAAALEVECLALRHFGARFAGRAPQKVDWAGQRVSAWRAANKTPKDPAGWRAVALVRMIEGRKDRAVKFINRALALDQGNAYSMFARVLIENPEPVSRELALRKVLDANPGLAGARIMLAGVMESQGRFRSAGDQYRAVLRDQPDNTTALAALSRILMADPKGGQKAAELLLKLISLEPGNNAAAFNLALTRIRLKEFGLAEEQLRRILKNNPKDTQARNLLGLAQKGRGEYQDAARTFERAIADDPGRPGAHYNLGALCAEKLKDETCAKRAFRRFLELEPMSKRSSMVRRWLQAHGG